MPVVPLQQRSLGERVADTLRRLVVTREISPGTPIVEDELASKFGVSRGPIRDAIKILTVEGLIERNGRSSVFRGLSEADVDELFSLREIIETAALKLAMSTDLEALLALLDTSLAAMAVSVEAESGADFPEADVEFHSATFAVAGHRRLRDIWELYLAGITSVLIASRETYLDLGPSYQSHVELREFVATGDFEKASSNLRSHLESARQRVRSFYTTAREQPSA